jgi:hypothetical protein
MQRILSTLLLVIASIPTWAQLDTVRVMQYNLLNYRNTTQQCTNSNNNATTKEGHLKTIVAHVKPDVLVVNEMGAHWLNPNKLLTGALNKDGINHFDQAEYSNNGFSSLTNMLFFNKNKLVLHSQDEIAKDTSGRDLVRLIDVYTLYMKWSGDLAQGDTAFLTFFVAHLKAGSTSADKEQRHQMTIAAMEYLKDLDRKGNYFFAGDFNIQTSSEKCYQEMVNHPITGIRFYDPKDAPGSWNNNSNYSNLHTQSTHTGDTRGGCFSGGGLDDRFDFILCDKATLNGVGSAKYISGTYKALGQDSRRFNGDIKNPSNNTIPSEVSNALYEMSDHLPVLMDVRMKGVNVGIGEITPNQILVSRGDNVLTVYLPQYEQVNKVWIVDITGKTVFEESVHNSKEEVGIQTSAWPSGIYMIQLSGGDGIFARQKLVID